MSTLFIDQIDDLLRQVALHGDEITVDRWRDLQQQYGRSFYNQGTLTALKSVVSKLNSDSSSPIGPLKHNPSLESGATSIDSKEVPNKTKPTSEHAEVNPYERAQHRIPAVTKDQLDAFARMLLTTEFSEFLTSTQKLLNFSEGESKSVLNRTHDFPAKSLQDVILLEDGVGPILVVGFNASARYHTALKVVFQRYPDAILFVRNTHGVIFLAHQLPNGRIERRFYSWHTSFPLADSIYTLVARFTKLQGHISEAPTEVFARWKHVLIDSPAEDLAISPLTENSKIERTFTFQGSAEWDAHQFYRTLPQSHKSHSPWDYLHSLNGILELTQFSSTDVRIQLTASSGELTHRDTLLSNYVLHQRRTLKLDLAVLVSTTKQQQHFHIPASIDIPDSSWALVVEDNLRALWPTEHSVINSNTSNQLVEESAKKSLDEEFDEEFDEELDEEFDEELDEEPDDSSFEETAIKFVFLSPVVAAIAASMRKKINYFNAVIAGKLLKNDGEIHDVITPVINEIFARWIGRHGDLELLGNTHITRQSIATTSRDLQIPQPLILRDEHANELRINDDLIVQEELLDTTLRLDPSAEMNLMGRWDSRTLAPPKIEQFNYLKEISQTIEATCVRIVRGNPHISNPRRVAFISSRLEHSSRKVGHELSLRVVSDKQGAAWTLKPRVGSTVMPGTPLFRRGSNSSDTPSLNLVSALQRPLEKHGKFPKGQRLSEIAQPLRRPIVVTGVEYSTTTNELDGTVAEVTTLRFRPVQRMFSKIVSTEAGDFSVEGVFAREDISNLYEDTIYHGYSSASFGSSCDVLLFEGSDQELNQLLDRHEPSVGCTALESDTSYTLKIQTPQNPVVAIEEDEDSSPMPSTATSHQFSIHDAGYLPSPHTPSISNLELALASIVAPNLAQFVQYQNSWSTGDEHSSISEWMSTVIASEISYSTLPPDPKTSHFRIKSSWLRSSKISSLPNLTRRLPETHDNRWECTCGQVTGRVNLGVQCTKCRSQVLFRIPADNLTKNGNNASAVLPFNGLHPWGSELFQVILGATALQLSNSGLVINDGAEQLRKDSKHLTSLLDHHALEFVYDSRIINSLLDFISPEELIERLIAKQIKQPHPILVPAHRRSLASAIETATLAAKFRTAYGAIEDYDAVKDLLSEHEQRNLSKIIWHQTKDYFGAPSSSIPSHDSLLTHLYKFFPTTRPFYLRRGINRSARHPYSPTLLDYAKPKMRHALILNRVRRVKLDTPSEAQRQHTERFLDVLRQPVYSLPAHPSAATNRTRKWADWYYPLNAGPPVALTTRHIRALIKSLSSIIHEVGGGQKFQLALYQMSAFFSSIYKSWKLATLSHTIHGEKNNELHEWKSGVHLYRTLIALIRTSESSWRYLLQWFGFLPTKGQKRRFETPTELAQHIDARLIKRIPEVSSHESLSLAIRILLGGVNTPSTQGLWSWSPSSIPNITTWVAPRLTGREDEHRFISLESLFVERPHLIFLFELQTAISPDLYDLVFPVPDKTCLEDPEPLDQYQNEPSSTHGLNSVELNEIIENFSDAYWNEAINSTLQPLADAGSSGKESSSSIDDLSNNQPTTFLDQGTDFQWERGNIISVITKLRNEP